MDNDGEQTFLLGKSWIDSQLLTKSSNMHHLPLVDACLLLSTIYRCCIWTKWRWC